MIIQYKRGFMSQHQTALQHAIDRNDVDTALAIVQRYPNIMNSYCVIFISFWQRLLNSDFCLFADCNSPLSYFLPKLTNLHAACKNFYNLLEHSNPLSRWLVFCNFFYNDFISTYQIPGSNNWFFALFCNQAYSFVY